MATKELKPNIRLIVTKGKDEGKIFETNRFPLVIGRDADADFVLDSDSSISRKHATIDVEEGTVYLEDLNSTNGSFVNNIRISQRVEIKSGMRFVLGKSWLVLVVLSANKGGADGGIDLGATSYLETKRTEAILVLDQFDSSGTADKFGDDAAMRITETLNRLTIPVVNQHRAQFIKGTGDGFLITFDQADNALTAATEILTRVKQHNKGKRAGKRIEIRMGLSYGTCHIEPEGDRHSQAVNIAFRVEGLRYRDLKKDRDAVDSRHFPDKGRIFITEDFKNSLESLKQVTFKYLGEYKLKGIQGTHKIFQVKV